MSKPEDCRWCGAELPREQTVAHAGLCPDCHDSYEVETLHSLHPNEERQPHND